MSVNSVILPDVQFVLGMKDPLSVIRLIQHLDLRVPGIPLELHWYFYMYSISMTVFSKRGTSEYRYRVVLQRMQIKLPFTSLQYNRIS
jgi:hypothetical protein